MMLWLRVFKETQVWSKHECRTASPMSGDENDDSMVEMGDYRLQFPSCVSGGGCVRA